MPDAGIGEGMAILGGTSLLGSLIGANATEKAAQSQVNAANNATQLQGAEFNTINSQFAPYRDAGANALQQMSEGTQPGGQFSGGMTQQQFLNNMDPAYGFLQQQAAQSAGQMYGAQGDFLSGGALKGLTQYSQNLASNEYQNAYNRYMNTRNTNYNQLAGLANLGAGAAAQNANLGASITGQMGQNIMQAGNSQSAGTIGTANQATGALGTMGNYAGQYGMLSALGLIQPSQTPNPYASTNLSWEQQNNAMNIGGPANADNPFAASYV